MSQTRFRLKSVLPVSRRRSSTTKRSTRRRSRPRSHGCTTPLRRRRAGDGLGGSPLDLDERRRLAELTCRFDRDRGAVVVSVGARRGGRRALPEHAEAPRDRRRWPSRRSRSPSTGENLSAITNGSSTPDVPLSSRTPAATSAGPCRSPMQARLLEEFGPDRVCFKPEATPIGPRLTRARDGTGGKRQDLRRHRRHRPARQPSSRHRRHDARRRSLRRHRGPLAAGGGGRARSFTSCRCPFRRWSRCRTALTPFSPSRSICS